MVFLTSCLNFSLSTLSLAKKAKADRLVVLCKSVVTGHGRMKARPRLADKLEFIDWDPSIKQAVLYIRVGLRRQPCFAHMRTL